MTSNNIKHNNIYITEVLAGEERTKEVKGYLMKLYAENFLNLKKETDFQVQEA